MSKSDNSAGEPGVDRGRESTTGSGGADRAPLPLAALGAFDIKGALSTLFERAGDNLTLPELQWLTEGCVGTANAMAADAAKLSQGIQCLVADDDVAGVGSFREPEDVAALLAHFGQVFQTITGLLELGMGAENRAAWRGRQ